MTPLYLRAWNAARINSLTSAPHSSLATVTLVRLTADEEPPWPPRHLPNLRLPSLQSPNLQPPNPQPLNPQSREHASPVCAASAGQPCRAAFPGGSVLSGVS